MAQPTGDVVRLAEARNTQEAHIWRQVLEEEGVECQVVGEYLEASFGDMPKIGPEVWVHRDNLEQARAILAGYRAEAASLDEEEEPEE